MAAKGIHTCYLSAGRGSEAKDEDDEKCQQKCQQIITAGSKMELQKASSS
jgi:hypothetical protein